VSIAGIIVVGAVATVVALDIFRDRIGFNGLGDGAGRIVADAILGIGAVFLVRVILGRRLVRLVPRVVGSFPLVGGAPAVSTAATAAAIASALLAFVLVVLGLSLLGLGAQQRLPVGHRDLIVVGMDFGEGQEAVPVAAIFDERGLKRPFHPRHAGQVDISLELLLVLGLEIEFFDAVTANDDNPRFLRVGGIY